MVRRLSAVTSIDVVGDSRLMEVDETPTLELLIVIPDDLIDPLMGQNHGRIVKVMGDGAMLVFASPASRRGPPYRMISI